MEKELFRQNNFDLLRLIAAMQVVMNHVVEIMEVHPTGVWRDVFRVFHLFPGVPIFFFISGFLISKSYENNPRLAEYFQNRILRLYPGLFACVTLSFILIYASGYMASAGASVTEWVMLYVAKVSFLQFYNPDFMRAYGDGVLNGSLWTITVELQFYLLIPVMYALLGLRASQTTNTRLLILIAIFVLINRLYVYMPAQYHDEIWYKLYRVSFLPWFYMFLTGVFVQRNFMFFYRLLAGRFLWVLAVYGVAGYFILKNNVPMGNYPNPVVYCLLVVVIFSFAYSWQGLSRKLLRGNDISYGVYIYHMPIINYLLYRGYVGDLGAALFAVVATVAIALASWVLIEKKSLALKRHPLNPLYNPPNRPGEW